LTVGERIKFIRERQGISQTELADVIGTTKQTIYKYENNIISNVPSDKIELIAQHLKVTPAYLMGWEEEPNSHEQEKSLYDQFDNIKPVHTKKFRLLGEIACGKHIYADEDYESYISADADIKADFCLKAKGDSMIGAGINEGDIVFIHEQPIVNSGEIAAVIIEDEATLKRVYYDKQHNRLQLVAANPIYMPLVYSDEELEHIRILGKAVALLRNL